MVHQSFLHLQINKAVNYPNRTVTFCIFTYCIGTITYCTKVYFCIDTAVNVPMEFVCINQKLVSKILEVALVCITIQSFKLNHSMESHHNGAHTYTVGGMHWRLTNTLTSNLQSCSYSIKRSPYILSIKPQNCPIVLLVYTPFQLDR